MKQLFGKTSLIIFLCCVSVIGAQAQPKIATCDLRKIFDNYYKTKQADILLKEEAADKSKQKKEMIDEFKKAEDEWKKLLDKANDQAISTDERDKGKQAAEKKLLELKEKEQLITQYERTARTQLEEKSRRKRDQVVQEIRDALNVKAKAEGYSLVIDTSAESVTATPFLLYTNGENDLTDKLLTQLNATAPAGVLKSIDEKKADEKGKK